MRKMISVLLLLCLMAGICGPAAAEESRDCLDFPESGFTFIMPDFVKTYRIMDIIEFNSENFRRKIFCCPINSGNYIKFIGFKVFQEA